MKGSRSLQSRARFRLVCRCFAFSGLSIICVNLGLLVWGATSRPRQETAPLWLELHLQPCHSSFVFGLGERSRVRWRQGRASSYPTRCSCGLARYWFYMGDPRRFTKWRPRHASGRFGRDGGAAIGELNVLRHNPAFERPQSFERSTASRMRPLGHG
jgi:hypothetical protein